MVDTTRLSGINDASGNNLELQELLKSMGVKQSEASGNSMLEYQMAESPLLSAYYNMLKSRGQGLGTTSIEGITSASKFGMGSLSKAELENLEKLQFAFEQQKILDQQQKLGGNSARLYQQTGGYANLQFVANEDQIPTNSGADKGRYEIRKITKEDTTPKVGMTKRAPVNPALVGTYQVTDTKTGTTKYYYVLKNATKNRNVDSPTTQNEVVKPLTPKASNKPSTGVDLKSSGASKPLPTPELFYSPDYKKLYFKEIKEMNMMLLNMTDILLSNYDFETIDTLVSEDINIVYSGDGEVLDFDYVDESSDILIQENPLISDIAFAVIEQSFSDLRDTLGGKTGGNYISFLSNFGHIKAGKQNITKYLPGYSKDGKPYYDLEVTVPDVPGVVGYQIYLIEEDGTI